MQAITARLKTAKTALEACKGSGTCRTNVSGIQTACLKELLQAQLPQLTGVHKADIMEELFTVGLEDGDAHELCSVLSGKQGKKQASKAMQDYTNMLDLFGEKAWEKLQSSATSRKSRMSVIFHMADKLGCISPSEATKLEWAKALDELGKKEYNARSLDEVRGDWKRFRRSAVVGDSVCSFERLPPYDELPEAVKELFKDDPPCERKVASGPMPLVRMRKRTPTVKLDAGGSFGWQGALPGSTEPLGQLGQIAQMMMAGMQQMQQRQDKTDRLLASLLGGDGALEVADGRREKMVRAAEVRFKGEERLAITDDPARGDVALACCKAGRCSMHGAHSREVSVVKNKVQSHSKRRRARLILILTLTFISWVFMPSCARPCNIQASALMQPSSARRRLLRSAAMARTSMVSATARA